MKEFAAPKGAPKWTTTFADLSTLLLTFFVLMLSFASIDIAKFREMLGSVNQAFGVTYKARGEYQAVLIEDDIKPKGNDANELWAENSNLADQTADMERKKELEKLGAAIEEAIEENQMENQTEIIKGKQGIRIRVNGYQMFQPGEAKLKEINHQFLDTICKGMNIFTYNLQIEGHTDNLPIHSEKYPSNWELSAARATSVARYLIQNGVDPKRLSAIGYADLYPIAPNEDLNGRAKNRRVEFVFTQKEPRLAIDENQYQKVG